MTKATRGRYTLEFKQEAVRLVESGQTMAAVSRSLGVVEQTLHNWVKAHRAGTLKGASGKLQVSAEQMEISRLRAELARVTMERDILGKSDGVLRKGPEMKYAFIQRHKRVWPIRVQCRVLRVSVSGYHQHLVRLREIAQRRHLSNEALLVHISAAYAENRGAYGWPRIWRQLRAQGIRVGKQRVQRLMQQHGIRARGKRRFRVTTTDSRHDLPIAPNLLNRNFTVAAPNQAWVGDLTYIATEEGWLFLAVVIDLFSRRVVGWSMQPDMRRDLVIDALEMAWFQRRPDRKAELMFHSDRGSQYASDDFSKVLKQCGITPSMSRKGNCWDNACSETLFGSLKVERLHGQRFETIRQAKDETIAWLLWYNQTRMHSTLHYASPMQFEKDWMDATVKIAA
ncbi:MAG: IS3 family transposase [Acidobacteriota bacterium]|nr:IS3 family transposase [Acidobacteriota bacterium]